MKARIRAIKFGALAEHIAAGLLRLKGYRILARQLRSPLGEIDIIARRGRTLAFVEVKARSTLTQAIEALSFHQRGRIHRAALAYTAHHPNFAGFDLRFDLIAVAPWQLPRHLPNAWQI
jgi:putative endonuclease|tara:strand:- start:3855 stop:4211 length:357 start_codon:yes stop_codon:yes gene_type:complete